MKKVGVERRQKHVMIPVFANYNFLHINDTTDFDANYV